MKAREVLDTVKEIPAEGAEWLAMAIKYAGADMIKMFLDKGVDIKMPPQVVNPVQQAADWATAYRSTPFIIQAAMRGNIDIFEAVANAGVDIWEIGHIGFSRKRKNSIIGTCLAAAAYHGHYKLLKTLLVKAQKHLGDHVNAPCKEMQDMSKTALMDDVKNKRDKKSAQTSYMPEFVDFQPIMLAVVSEKASLGGVKDLLAAQANFGMHDKINKDNILHLAARWAPSVDILEYLVCNLD